MKRMLEEIKKKKNKKKFKKERKNNLATVTCHNHCTTTAYPTLIITNQWPPMANPLTLTPTDPGSNIAARATATSCVAWQRPQRGCEICTCYRYNFTCVESWSSGSSIIGLMSTTSGLTFERHTHTQIDLRNSLLKKLTLICIHMFHMYRIGILKLLNSDFFSILM